MERIQLEGAADILPGPSFGSDLAWVRTAENRVRIGVSHALTDGVGINMYSRLLLYHYFCLKDGTAYPNPFADPLTGTVNSDADSDVYTDRLFPEISAPAAEEGTGEARGPKTRVQEASWDAAREGFCIH